jgi:hypothetical protein
MEAPRFSAARYLLNIVMPALVAGIHVLLFQGKQGVDGRDKPGHDDEIAASAYFARTYFPSFTVRMMRERSSRP